MTTAPAILFKCLADETRLRTLLLLQAEGELCVCEIAEALALSQPKVSRHLASLRANGLLLDTRHGQWIYYQLHPDLPAWIAGVLGTTARAHPQPLQEDRQRLSRMGDRPERQANCC